MQEDGKLTTSDDPPVVFGSLEVDFIQKVMWHSFFFSSLRNGIVKSMSSIMQSEFRAGSLLRFAIKDENVRVVDGKLEIGDLQFISKSNRARAFADSYSKVRM